MGTDEGDILSEIETPRNSSDVATYFTNRLQNAFDYFLEQEKNNAFAKIGKEGWILSTDAAETLSSEQKQKLEALMQWLSSICGQSSFPIC